MRVTEATVSIADFAKGRFQAGGEFAEGVARFASRFGPVDDDLLSILAQAGYLCWTHVRAEENLLAACEAIATGRPTRHYYHCQVTADRWNEVHGYLIGVQRWFRVSMPLPPEIDRQKVDQITMWLGEPTPAKRALAELLLMRLVDDLLNYVSFAAIGVDDAPKENAFSDFSAWYFADDGRLYATPRQGDASRLPFTDPRFKKRVEELAQTVRQEMAGSPDEAAELIERVLRQTQPPCQHRFTRYLDVQIASIGALQWRGHLPPDGLPKEAWETFREQAQGGLRTWAEGAPPPNGLPQRIHAALGPATELKRAVVQDFLLAGFWDEGDGAGWDWLVPKAQVDGTNAFSRFQLATLFGRGERPNPLDAGDT